MQPGQIGYVAGAFGLSLICGIVAKWIALLSKASLEVRYTVAAAATLLPDLAQVSIGGPDALGLVGALLAAGVLFWWFTVDRAKRDRLGQSRQVECLPKK